MNEAMRGLLFNISIHVPLAGDDYFGPTDKFCCCIFLSTSPLRGTTYKGWELLYVGEISIHVPLAGDDSPAAPCCKTVHYFYPRPPCGGRPGQDSRLLRLHQDFYPCPPCGGRRWRCRSCPPPCHFYPRPPCGGRRSTSSSLSISILFLSTSPLRGTTAGRLGVAHAVRDISIHVPLAGDDARPCGTRRWRRYFYPRPPCGGRRLPMCSTGPEPAFLSTSPLRGTTRRCSAACAAVQISIHVPLAGDDNIPTPTHCRHRNFYPRPPCGGRHQQRTAQAVLQSISIHVPLAGDDGGCMIMEKYDYLFLSTSPLRGTTRRGCRVRSCYSFLSTSPLRGATGGLT